GAAGFQLLPPILSLQDDFALLSLAAGDLDADGEVDLAAGVRSPGGGSIWIFKNLGGGAFEFAETFGQFGQPSSLIASDLDGAGRLDLAVGDCSLSGSTSILLSDGRGAFTASDPLPGAGCGLLLAADLNGDRSPDLVLSADNGITLFRNLSRPPASRDR